MNRAKVSKDTIFLWLLRAFACSVPISQFVSVRVLVILTLFSLATTKPSAMIARLLNRGWSMLGFIVLLALGLVYTSDWHTGMGVLETSFALLALPIVFSFFEAPSKSTIGSVITWFVVGVVAACLFCLTMATIDYWKTGDVAAFFFYRFTEHISSQPTYLAYYLIASITYLLYIVFSGELNRMRWAIVGVAIFLCASLILTSGTTTFISLLFTLSFFVLKFIVEPADSSRWIVLTTVVLMILGLFGSHVLNERTESDYWERSALWEAAIRANPNPVFGVGTGDYKWVMDKYYKAHGLEQYAAEDFNAHNQFVEVYLILGGIGIMAFVVMMGHSIFLASQANNALGVLLMFPFLVYGVTEVFLGRYQGVVFFALMHQVTVAMSMNFEAAHGVKESFSIPE